MGKIKNINIYFLLLIFAVLYLLIFSLTTTPLTDGFWGYDSAFFILVGKGMTDGLLPYRDFFDMKGPILFFIEYLGQLIVRGKTGAFIIQVINLWITILFFYKILSLRLKKIMPKLIILCVVALYAVYPVGGGNLTEELSLSGLSGSLYLCLSYLKRAIESENFYHNPINAAIYGAIFSAIAFIRITNTALICAIVFSICVILVCKKEYINLFENAISFLAGVCIILIPVIAFYWSKGLLHEMLYQVFAFGFKYSNQIPLIDRVEEVIFGRYNVYFLPIAVSLVMATALFSWKNEESRYYLLLSYISLFATLFAICCGYNFEHYYTLLIPVLFLVIYIYIYIYIYIVVLLAKK